MGSGVCMLSRYCLQDVFFHQWPVNGYVHKLQHGDWFGGKGVGLCRLKIDDCNINIYSAHVNISTDINSWCIWIAFAVACGIWQGLWRIPGPQGFASVRHCSIYPAHLRRGRPCDTSGGSEHWTWRFGLQVARFKIRDARDSDLVKYWIFGDLI